MFVRYCLLRGIEVGLECRHLSGNGSGNNASKWAVNPIFLRKRCARKCGHNLYSICIFHIISYMSNNTILMRCLFCFANLHADLAKTLSKIKRTDIEVRDSKNLHLKRNTSRCYTDTVSVTCKITWKTGLLAKSGMLFGYSLLTFVLLYLAIGRKRKDENGAVYLAMLRTAYRHK
jgi:hypothetical protein